MKKLTNKTNKKKLVKKPAAKMNTVKAYGCSCGKLYAGQYSSYLDHIG